MPRWSLLFALLAVVAGACGIRVAGVAADIAWLFGIIFLAMLVISVVGRALRGQSLE